MENLDPPLPQIKDGKMARFCPSHGFILNLGGWGFAVPFYFVQDCRALNTHRITSCHVSSGGQESKCQVDVSQRK